MFALDDPEKIKSIANYDWFWVEEATELTYDDFIQLDLRLRGAQNHKIICTFNPISSRHRLKTAVFDNHWENAVWIMKTAWDNKFVDQAYLKQLETLKDRNPQHYRIYALNEWGEAVE
jgi:phage terminase large subunit